MKILSIETTSEMGSIAICEEEIVNEIFFFSKDVAEELISHLEYLLERTHLTISDFDYIVVSIGPGSWTGIRVGISFAKGLVKGEKEKIYCVSVPESLFFAIKGFRKPSICVINAYRGEFYISFFNGKFLFKNSFRIKKIKREQLESILKEKKYLVVGPGILQLKDILKQNCLLPPFYWFPRASFNALVAVEKIKRKIPSQLPEPYYGR